VDVELALIGRADLTPQQVVTMVNTAATPAAG
jgi:hypothetical protein